MNELNYGTLRFSLNASDAILDAIIFFDFLSSILKRKNMLEAISKIKMIEEGENNNNG